MKHGVLEKKERDLKSNRWHSRWSEATHKTNYKRRVHVYRNIHISSVFLTLSLDTRCVGVWRSGYSMGLVIQTLWVQSPLWPTCCALEWGTLLQLVNYTQVNKWVPAFFNSGNVKDSLWKRCSDPPTAKVWVWPNRFERVLGTPFPYIIQDWSPLSLPLQCCVRSELTTPFNKHVFSSIVAPL